MVRARLRAEQMRDADVLTENEHDSWVHENLVTSGTLTVNNASVTGFTIEYSNDDIVLTNTDPDGDVYIKATNASSQVKTGIHIQPDASTALYHAGVAAARTYGNGGLQYFKQGAAGTSGYIYDKSGVGFTMQSATGETIAFHHVNEPMAVFTADGAIKLYHDGSLALETTTTTGIDVTGEVTATTYYGDGSNLTGVGGTPGSLYYNDTDVKATATAAGIEITDGTYTSTIGYVSDDLQIINTATNGIIQFYMDDNTGNQELVVNLDTDSGHDFYVKESLGVKMIQTGLWIMGGSQSLYTSITQTGANFLIDNSEAGGTITLQGEKAATGNSTLAVFDPDGADELYYAGSKVMETISDGIQVNDILEPTRITEIKQNTDIFQIINRQHNGGLQIRCEDSNGTERPLFYGAASGTDPKVYLYAGAGVSVMSTSDNGSEGGINIIRGSAPGTSGATASINSNNKIFYLRNNYDGGNVYIQGDSDNGTQVNMMTLDPHGSWVFSSRNSGDSATNTLAVFDPDGAAELYYAGTKKVETTDYGLSFGANTISGTGDIYCNDIHTAGGSVYIGNLKLSSSDGETLLVNDVESGTSSGTGAQTFLELTDTPSSYAGTTGQYLMSTGSGTIWSAIEAADGGDIWTYTDEQATTAGTYIDFTGIPSDAIDVDIILDGVSTNTDAQGVIIQIGDSGGIATSGYETEMIHFAAGSNNIYDRTNCFGTCLDSSVEAGDTVDGRLRLNRWGTTDHLWIGTGFFAETLTAGEHGELVVGKKTLSSALTTIRLTTPGGSATFDAGKAIVRYRTAQSEPNLPTAYINGLILSNGTDSEHDIDISSGKARNEDDSANITFSSTITKQIDASWAAGTDAGGLFSGSVAADTWYHVFAIRKDDGAVDAGFDTDVTASGIPSGYTSYRRLGSVLTDGSANILAFKQYGDEFLWSTPILDEDQFNPGTSRVTPTLSVPPDLEVNASFFLVAQDNSATAGTGIYITSPDLADIAPTASDWDMNVNSSTVKSEAHIHMRTNTSSQIAYRFSASTADHRIRIRTHGWIDSRGKQ